MSTQKAYSMATAETYSISRANVNPEGLFDGNCRWVDAEVRELVDRAYSRSKQIITTHFDILHKLAQILKEEETVDRKQLHEHLHLYKSQSCMSCNFVYVRLEETDTQNLRLVPSTGTPLVTTLSNFSDQNLKPQHS